MSSEPERWLRQSPYSNADRDDRVAPQEFRCRRALVHAPTIEMASVMDMRKVRQRVPQVNHSTKIGDIVVRDHVALTAAAEGVGELDALGNVIDQQAGMQIGGQQVFDEALTQEDGSHEIAVHERRARLDPREIGRMATEDHRAGAPHLAAEIGQHSETADLLRQIVMQVRQQMPDKIQIRQVQIRLIAPARGHAAVARPLKTSCSMAGISASTSCAV